MYFIKNALVLLIIIGSLVQARTQSYVESGKSVKFKNSNLVKFAKEEIDDEEDDSDEDDSEDTEDDTEFTDQDNESRKKKEKAGTKKQSNKNEDTISDDEEYSSGESKKIN